MFNEPREHWKRVFRHQSAAGCAHNVAAGQTSEVQIYKRDNSQTHEEEGERETAFHSLYNKLQDVNVYQSISAVGDNLIHRNSLLYEHVTTMLRLVSCVFLQTM